MVMSPPLRLLVALLLSVTIAAVTSFWAAGAALVAALIALALGRTTWQILRPRLLAVNIFLLFMWLIVPFSMSLDLLGQYSRTGVLLCLLITIKANALVAIFTAFLSPMSPYTLGAALCGLGCPAKLIWLFLLLECNICILRREWTSLQEAARLRAFAPTASLHCYKTMSALLAQWFIRAWEKARLLQDALLLRGYDGEVRFASSGRHMSGWICVPPVLAVITILLYLNHRLP